MLLELIFDRTDTCGLGLGEDGGWHDVETDTIGLTQNLIDNMNSLHLGSMSEHLTGITIANSINTLDIGFEVFVDLDALTFIVFDAGIGEISLNTRFATCGHQDNISVKVGHILYGGLHLKGDATLLENFTQTLGDVAIEGRKALFQILDNRHLRAKTIEHRSELHADNACTNDAKALRKGVEV